MWFLTQRARVHREERKLKSWRRIRSFRALLRQDEGPWISELSSRSGDGTDEFLDAVAGGCGDGVEGKIILSQKVRSFADASLVGGGV